MTINELFLYVYVLYLYIWFPLFFAVSIYVSTEMSSYLSEFRSDWGPISDWV